MFCMQGLCAHRALRRAAASGAAMCAPRHYVYRISPARRAGIFGVAVRTFGAAARAGCRGVWADVWRPPCEKEICRMEISGMGISGRIMEYRVPNVVNRAAEMGKSKSVNIKNRSNLGICCLGNCVRCGFHNFIENGFAGGITAGREAAYGRNHRSIFGATHGGFSEEEHSGWQN